MVRATIYKEVLPNGLVVLVLPRHDIPKVCVQLFYNVGSKDEGVGLWDPNQQKWVNEQGIAHFIEHMIFKGTSNLTESDINQLTARLSGSCNAFTSYDYTGYLFEMPSQHWYEALPVMADCMKNCTFKQEHINSEVKAVIQEIKMYNDDYVATLIERMIASIFNDHPYHHPVIGYKQDLWNFKRENLLEFYRTHYCPNNAVLVVTGDVAPTDVFKRAEEAFGGIAPVEGYVKKRFSHTPDMSAQNVVIHRDVQQPILLYCWEVPGSRDKKDYLLDLMSWIVGAGKGARLYNKLVTEMGIATELQSFVYDLFDHGLFFLYIQPRTLADVELIRKAITEEIHDLCAKEIADQELRRAQKKTEMDFLNLSEDNQKQGYLIGKSYLVTGDENYLLNYCSYPQENLKKDIQQLFKRYFSPSVMHSGQVLPLTNDDKLMWLEQQKKSDEEDTRILSALSRQEAVEEASYAHSISVERPQQFTFPKGQKLVLSNGLTVLYYNKADLGKIDIIMDLKAKHYYDLPSKQGVSVLMYDLLQEGTKTYSAQELAVELESYGMELNTFPGQVGMTLLSQDLQKGLEILTDVLVNPLFKSEDLERIREQLLAELGFFWDTPKEFSTQVLRKAVYKNHPYGLNSMGDQKTLKTITREDIIDAHKRYVTPQGARIAIVGDLSNCDIQKVLESTLGTWKGPIVPDLAFPVIEPVKAEIINYPINRDQVVLCYGGLSVDRFDDDYDALLLFDQIFTGGLLGSMNSRLFELREHTGLFYTIGGSLLAGVNRQKGMVFVKTIVSNDRLEEAEKAIEALINQGAQTFTLEEIEEAQLAIINSLVDNFASNRQISATLIYIEKFGLPENYFDVRVAQLSEVSLEHVKETVKKYLDTNKMVKLRVGRI